MKIQVHTDNHIQGSAKLTRQVETEVNRVLAVRFGDRISRLEVHLSDVNSSQKGGGDDKRCVMEARLAGLKPITVSHQGASLKQALDGAAETLQKTLKRTLGRLDDIQRRTSNADEQPTRTGDSA